MHGEVNTSSAHVNSLNDDDGCSCNDNSLVLQVNSKRKENSGIKSSSRLSVAQSDNVDKILVHHEYYEEHRLTYVCYLVLFRTIASPLTRILSSDLPLQKCVFASGMCKTSLIAHIFCSASGNRAI